MHIDPWTIGLQSVNFLILVWLLQHFLYAPVTKIVQTRRAETERLIASAEAKRTEAESIKAALDARMHGIEAERAAMLNAAHIEAAAVAAREQVAAQSRADAIVAAARHQVDDERRAAETALQSTARELALAIARRLLAAIAPAVPLVPFIDAACAEVERAVASGNGTLLLPDETVEVASSEPLPAASAERLKTRLSEIFGRPVTLAFRVEPELAVGIECDFPRLVVRRCWSDDLTRISKELEHGGDAHRSPRAMAG